MRRTYCGGWNQFHIDYRRAEQYDRELAGSRVAGSVFDESSRPT
jgi:hypothetical protein